MPTRPNYSPGVPDDDCYDKGQDVSNRILCLTHRLFRPDAEQLRRGEMAMGLLDYIRNRSNQEPAIAAKPQVRETEAPNVANLPESVKAQAVEAAHPAAKLMDRATQHRTQNPDAPTDHSGSREALMHNQSAHGKSQEAMSPTDSHKGHTQSQARTMDRSRGMER